ncbi:Hypothetical predicted protein [Lecanosticta acicola]|uniref:DUF7357 domain-containing protein n=1 Tax=Lecanosticta acicola TaxID=111012 RepID=A0AAI8W1A8_9PEZI|nr:Hypothetical predicted protein [Lecanosticta acicola]
MRLRVRIERNELPAVSVLWAIGNTELKQTVAQFLERVDERFPLEGGSWGFEDYSVSVGGFEVLHYNEVGTVFQNEDEVVIKPLQTADVRARRITGREQIAQDGRHMLDGVPWGKPCLKRPIRPHLAIPPRKRQRMENSTPLAIGNGEEQDLMAIEDDDDEEEEDMDFEYGEEDDDSDVDSEEDDGSQTETEPVTKRTTRRSAHLDEEAELDGTEEEGSDDDEDEDKTPSEDESDTSDDDSSSDSSGGSSSSDSDDASSEASEASWNGISTSAAAAAEVSPTSSPQSVCVITERSNSKPSQPSGLPYQGKPETKSRNMRRRQQRQLRFLKEIGVIHSDATLRDLVKMPKKELALHLKKSETLRNTLVDYPGPTSLERKDHHEIEDESETALLHGAQAALDQAKEMTTTITSPEVDVPPHAMNDNSTVANGADAEADTGADDDPPEVESTTQRPKRIDLAATNRLLFGSLGVRTPKTQAEKDALQEKLTARSKRKLPTNYPEQPLPQPEQTDQAELPNAWLDKVEVSAVECCDDGVTLSAPPFPFKQRWDPQYQYQKNKRNSSASNLSKRQKKRKTNVNGEQYVESYDKYNTNGGSDALDYDDPLEDEDDSYWEDGALLDDAYNKEEEEEEEEAQSTVDDGFPSLPDDVSSLPLLSKANALKGDFVVFNELAVSAATNWQPGTITRTVRLESKDGDAWIVKLAKRDMQPKEYDEDGNRVYRKFEMEGLSEDEGDDDVQILQWAEMQDPRLLHRVATE